MIKPLNHNILIKELPRAQASDGGISYPDSFDDSLLRSWVYQVVSKGSACDSYINPGDRVVLDQFSFNARTAAGHGLWLVHEKSVSVVIPGNPSIAS
jgi:co-chaperonin GroES (HSP10)